jgi:superfamily I DNA and RNA helicase
LLQFEVFETSEAQTAWLVAEIQKNLSEDELIPDDVVVINPDPIKTKEAVGPARQALMQQGINSNLAGVTTMADIFTEPGTVTFTGIFRAKGNEAAMVYVINAHDCFDSYHPREVARIRNQLFTAVTRSKAWVRVLGVGPRMAALKAEFEKVKAAQFVLRFRYPTEDERKTMQTVNRDMSKADQERSNRRRINFAEIVASLDAGESFIEDYPDEVVRKFQAYLARKTKKRRI